MHYPRFMDPTMSQLRASALIALLLAACGSEQHTAPAAHLEGDTVLNEPILLEDGAVISGEGIGRTVLKAGRTMEAMIASRDPERGHTHIFIRELTVDCDGKASFGILGTRLSNVILENVEVKDCQVDGIRLTGRGQWSRNFRLENITSHDNDGSGVVVMWAMRDGIYSNVMAQNNGDIGIILDHSEFTASNLVARANRGDGIFLRNLFGTSTSNLTATHNGRHGILVQGWVHSVGTNWRSQANSTAAAGEFDNIHFSGDSSLSYGVTRSSVLSGAIASEYHEFGSGSQPAHNLLVSPEVKELEMTGVVTTIEPKL